jgi:tetratricopeptide (TPR) repeat protein
MVSKRPAGVRLALGSVSVFCATLLAYLPSIRGGMLWDDGAHVTSPDLQSFHGLWRIWFELDATQQYYPLLHSAFWLEHRLWGDAVLGYHLTNIVLHCAAACLVVLIVQRLGWPGAWLAGFLFALHPVCTEAVAWISEQKNTLSAVFYLSAALVYLDFDRTRRRSRYLLALGVFLAALLTKTVTATLPAALLLVFWTRRKLEWRRDVMPLVPWIGLGAAAGLFTAWVERTLIGARGANFHLSLIERCLLAGRAIWFYLAKLIWPANLMFIYPRWTLDAGAWWQYLFPLAALGLAAFLWRMSRPLLAGFLFFAGTLFPVLGFFNVFPFIYSYVADHFQYLASLGVLVPAAAGLTMATDRIPAAPKWLQPALAAALVTTLGGLTWRQSEMYRDSDTLYRETLARNPGAWLAHNNLAVELLNVPGRLGEARSHLEATLRLNPDWAEAHMSLANALLQAPGRNEQAIAEYQAALRLNPGWAEAHMNLGIVLAQVPERVPEAIAEYETALRIDPQYAKAHMNLANTVSPLPGRLPEAIQHYEAALRINPDLAEAHYNLGNALLRTPGGVPGAVAEYQSALRLKPRWVEARFNLGAALARIPGRIPDAIQEWQTVLQLQPDYAPARRILQQLGTGRK